MTSQEHNTLYTLAYTAQKKAIRLRQRRKHAVAATHALSTPTRLSPTQLIGRQAEEQAKNHLQAAGLVVLKQNLRCKAGEIDLICLDQTVLAFIEVRHRQSNRYGGAAASVNLSKQRRLIKTAQYFLPRLTQRYFQGHTPACRFDVVTIEPHGLSWLKNAFTMV